MNYLGIEQSKLKEVADKMNILLAGYNVYYQNLRSFHWHINGNSFFDMHNVFEDLYNDAKVKIDDIAERILTIGHKPYGSMLDYLAKSTIDETRDRLEDEIMVNKIISNHAELIRLSRDIISTASRNNDEGTVDMMGGILSTIEKKSWMLSSWLSKRSAAITSCN